MSEYCKNRKGKMSGMPPKRRKSLGEGRENMSREGNVLHPDNSNSRKKCTEFLLF